MCEEGLCPTIEREATADGPAPTAKELTDEIKGFRQKNKEFQATNDHETYLIWVYSCKEDKKAALKALGLEKEHTMVDGYELSRIIGRGPTRPSLELRGPLEP